MNWIELKHNGKTDKQIVCSQQKWWFFFFKFIIESKLPEYKNSLRNFIKKNFIEIVSRAICLNKNKEFEEKAFNRLKNRRIKHVSEFERNRNETKSYDQL